MSKLSYSMTMSHHLNPGPDISNSMLVVPPSVTLPPLDLIMPHEKSVFGWLLEGQENSRIGNRRELDYVSVTTHSPLHCVDGQQIPAWIVTQMGIEGGERVFEWVKLELGVGVWLFDEGLSKKNYGFEKVC